MFAPICNLFRLTNYNALKSFDSWNPLRPTGELTHSSVPDAIAGFRGPLHGRAGRGR